MAEQEGRPRTKHGWDEIVLVRLGGIRRLGLIHVSLFFSALASLIQAGEAVNTIA